MAWYVGFVIALLSCCLLTFPFFFCPSQLKGRIPILHLLFVLAIVYTLSSFVLFEELDTKDSPKSFSIKTLVWKVKASHRKLARTIRRDLIKDVFVNKRLEAVCSSEFGCILPRPTLFRSASLKQPQVQLAPNSIELELPLVEFPEPESESDRSGASSGQDGETPARAVEAQSRRHSSPSLQLNRRANSNPGGSKTAAEEPRKEGPYRLSKRVQGELHDRQRIENLLNTKVDVVMNQLVLEMQGGISCGGKPVMEFRDIDAVLAAHPQLSEVLPEQDEIGGAHFGTCAVVGNSGNLLQKGHGKDIDAHDTVIRFNGAPTVHYEEDVGSKTTIRIQNVDNLGFHEHNDKYLIFTARNKRDLQKFVNHRKRYSRRKQFAFNSEFWCHIWDWVSHRKLKPSTGLAGIILALRTCDHPINLYGFSHNDTNFHYFNHLPPKVSTSPKATLTLKEGSNRNQRYLLTTVTLCLHFISPLGDHSGCV